VSISSTGLGHRERKAASASSSGFSGIEPLLTVRECVHLLRCSVSALNKWRVSGGGPRFVYVGSRVRYRPADIAAYIAEQTRASTSQETAA
jgi:predicted DNA-binding transcriptional regulator AlpA